MEQLIFELTFVMPRTISMDVTKALDDPVSSHPTTSGKVRVTGRPSITASVSMPPTPVEKDKCISKGHLTTIQIRYVPF